MTREQVANKVREGIASKKLMVEVLEGSRMGVRPHANLINAESGGMVATVWLQLDGKTPKKELRELATENLITAVFEQLNNT